MDEHRSVTSPEVTIERLEHEHHIGRTLLAAQLRDLAAAVGKLIDAGEATAEHLPTATSDRVMVLVEDARWLFKDVG